MTTMDYHSARLALYMQDDIDLGSDAEDGAEDLNVDIDLDQKAEASECSLEEASDFDDDDASFASEQSAEVAIQRHSDPNLLMLGKTPISDVPETKSHIKLSKRATSCGTLLAMSAAVPSTRRSRPKKTSGLDAVSEHGTKATRKKTGHHKERTKQLPPRGRSDGRERHASFKKAVARSKSHGRSPAGSPCGKRESRDGNSPRRSKRSESKSPRASPHRSSSSSRPSEFRQRSSSRRNEGSPRTRSRSSKVSEGTRTRNKVEHTRSLRAESAVSDTLTRRKVGRTRSLRAESSFESDGDDNGLARHSAHGRTSKAERRARSRKESASVSPVPTRQSVRRGRRSRGDRTGKRPSVNTRLSNQLVQSLDRYDAELDAMESSEESDHELEECDEELTREILEKIELAKAKLEQERNNNAPGAAVIVAPARMAASLAMTATKAAADVANTTASTVKSSTAQIASTSLHLASNAATTSVNFASHAATVVGKDVVKGTGMVLDVTGKVGKGVVGGTTGMVLDVTGKVGKGVVGGTGMVLDVTGKVVKGTASGLDGVVNNVTEKVGKEVAMVRGLVVKGTEKVVKGISNPGGYDGVAETSTLHGSEKMEPGTEAKDAATLLTSSAA